MLNLPRSTEFNRRVPKQMFYENLEISPEVKRLFVEQIRAVIWANKLSAQTMNIAAGQTVQEIEVLHLKLSGTALDDKVLTLMDKKIPYHILYLLESAEGLFRLQIAYKEQSGGQNAFQVKRNFATPWQALEEFSLPLAALDMDSLYEGIVRYVAGGELADKAGSLDLKGAVEQSEEQERLKKQIVKLKAKMRQEKQLARQMKLRREIQELERNVNK